MPKLSDNSNFPPLKYISGLPLIPVRLRYTYLPGHTCYKNGINNARLEVSSLIGLVGGKTLLLTMYPNPELNTVHISLLAPLDPRNSWISYSVHV